MWTFRPAGIADHDAVIQLWAAVGLGRTTEEEWDALVSGPSSIVLLAESGGLSGTAVATFDGWRAYIYHVAVAPECRGMGLARELMDQAEQHLTVAGAQRIYLMVKETNTAGLALAAHTGYLPEGDIAMVKETGSAMRKRDAKLLAVN